MGAKITSFLCGNLISRRHKDICSAADIRMPPRNQISASGRQLVMDGVAPDSCTADLVAFLQR